MLHYKLNIACLWDHTWWHLLAAPGNTWRRLLVKPAGTSLMLHKGVIVCTSTLIIKEMSEQQLLTCRPQFSRVKKECSLPLPSFQPTVTKEKTFFFIRLQQVFFGIRQRLPSSFSFYLRKWEWVEKEGNRWCSEIPACTADYSEWRKALTLKLKLCWTIVFVAPNTAVKQIWKFQPYVQLANVPSGAFFCNVLTREFLIKTIFCGFAIKYSTYTVCAPNILGTPGPFETQVAES